MRGIEEVRRGMSIRRGVTASDVPAGQTEAKVHPVGESDGQALLASLRGLGLRVPGFVEVRTGHVSPLRSSKDSSRSIWRCARTNTSSGMRPSSRAVRNTSRSASSISRRSRTYALDGRLIGAPNMNEVAGFDKREYPLHSACLETWQGFLFVNLNPKAEPLAEAADAAGREADVYVEIDVGMRRVGVATPDDAIAIARRVRSLSPLRYRGIAFYPGHVRQHIARQDDVLCRFVQRGFNVLRSLTRDAVRPSLKRP